MSRFLLGIDIGTGSSKGVLSTIDGDIVATSSRPHQMSMPRPGWAEMDAHEIWWGDVVPLCQELVAQAKGAGIAGVAVSGIGPCLLMCDAAGTPLRPATLYGIDGRAAFEITELTGHCGEEQILTRAGSTLSSQAVGPKGPVGAPPRTTGLGAAHRWYGSSSFVVGRLTGEYVLDHHTASQRHPCTT